MRKILLSPLLLLLTSSISMAQAVTKSAPPQSCYLPADSVNPYLGWALIIIIIIAFIYLAGWKRLLRDKVTDQAAFMAQAQNTRYAGKAFDDIPRPYSLSRTQLGLWTTVIACSYVYVELCHKFCITELPIDNTLLALMGISAGTTAVGSVIDTSNNNVPHHQDGPSEGLLADILSDQDGISIHRLQNVIWTLVAAVIFLCQLGAVPYDSLPILDPNLVALTGISSLVYLGVKTNENKPPVAPVVPAGGGNPQPGGGLQQQQPVVPQPIVQPQPIQPAPVQPQPPVQQPMQQPAPQPIQQAIPQAPVQQPPNNPAV